jgi:hypothetical protein
VELEILPEIRRLKCESFKSSTHSFSISLSLKMPSGNSPFRNGFLEMTLKEEEK